MEQLSQIKGYKTLTDKSFAFKDCRKTIGPYHHYAPTSTRSDQDIHKFYEDLEQTIKGDFNAKVEGREENVVGPHRLDLRNIRGEKLFERCHKNSLNIGKTRFQQPTRVRRK